MKVMDGREHVSKNAADMEGCKEGGRGMRRKSQKSSRSPSFSADQEGKRLSTYGHLYGCLLLYGARNRDSKTLVVVTGNCEAILRAAANLALGRKEMQS